MATVLARERILDAAQRVARDLGAARLTLEVVAQAAGVSKGGLLYHFPNKEALIAALADEYVASMDRCIVHALAQQDGAGDDISRELQAHIVGVLQGQSRLRTETLGAALLVAAANDMNSLKVIRDKLRKQNERQESLGKSYAAATVILLAIDGLILRESLHVSPFTEQQRERVIAGLLEQARRVAATHDL
jgi:AcrR family transcriptional regulator